MNEFGEKHIKHLDGLRGLAILLVLLRHFTDDTLVEKIFLLGWTGVDLFFVLSGFLITGILLDTKDKKGYYRIFIFRRILRIFPVYYGVLICCFLAAPFLSILDWFKNDYLYFLTYTQNYLIAKKDFFTLPLGHFWSLAIEEQFYLLWPLIIFLLKPKQLLLLIIILLGVGIILRFNHPAMPFIYVFTPTHWDGLLAGSAIAILIRTYKNELLKSAPFTFVIITIGMVVFFGVQDPWNGYSISFIHFGYTIIGLFYAGLLAYSFTSTKIQKALSFRTLIVLGKYSYGIYVYHPILINLAKYYFPGYIHNYRILTYITILVLSLMISYYSYQLIEKQFLKLKPSFKTETSAYTL